MLRGFDLFSGRFHRLDMTLAVAEALNTNNKIFIYFLVEDPVRQTITVRASRSVGLPIIVLYLLDLF